MTKRKIIGGVYNPKYCADIFYIKDELSLNIASQMFECMKEELSPLKGTSTIQGGNNAK